MGPPPFAVHSTYLHEKQRYGVLLGVLPRFRGYNRVLLGVVLHAQERSLLLRRWNQIGMALRRCRAVSVYLKNAAEE